MTTVPDLQFRPLDEAERELLAALADASRPGAEPRSVNFGTDLGGEAELWGLFVRGVLSGGASFAPSKGGWAEVKALCLARDWWNTGLAEWILNELSRSAELGGSVGVVVKIAEAAPAAGETLADAGFAGPDAEAEGWPAGEWRRRAKPYRATAINQG